MCFAEGCFGFERKLPDPAQRVVVTTRSHDTEAVRKCIAACEPTEVIRVGGAGHKVIHVMRLLSVVANLLVQLVLDSMSTETLLVLCHRRSPEVNPKHQ